MPDNPYGPDGGPLDPARHRPHGTNGVRPGGMHMRSVPFDEFEDPIDLVAVQADDELINALAVGMSVSAPGLSGYDADDRVAAILAAWKADVDATPVPELVDVDTAVSTVLAARPPSRRARHLAPVAAAAAFIVLAIGGVSVGSYSASPDDALWGVTRVLYSERAESVEAAARVEDRIANAKEALVAGRPVLAAQELAQAQADLAAVRPEEGQTELAEVQDFLVAKAAETPPGQPTNPGAPLATQPSRPVPPGATVRPRPAPQQGSTSGTESTPTGTPAPGAPGGPDGSTTTDEDMRLRQAPADPGDATSGSADPSTSPTPTGTEEGDPDSTGSGTPTATPEGEPEPTTTPGQSMDGPASGSGGATASGSETQPTSN